MSLKEDIQPYIYMKSVINLQPNQDWYEDNPNLFTAVYLYLSKKLAAMGEEEYDLDMDAKYYDYKAHCEIRPGLYRRSPTNETRIISQDEMIGITSTDRAAANRIVTYGQDNCYIYDNRHDAGIHYQAFFNLIYFIALGIGLSFLDLDILPFLLLGAFFVFQVYQAASMPVLQGWQTRFLYAIPYYKARAQTKLSLLNKIMYSLALIYEAKFVSIGEISGRQLMYLTLDEMSTQKSWILNLGLSIFKKHLRDVYGDLSGMFEIYYPKGHPFVKYSKGVKF